MPMSYKRLFHLLLERDLKDSDLKKKAGISAPTLAKLRAGQTITTEMLCKICNALECQPSDIMEYIPENTMK